MCSLMPSGGKVFLQEAGLPLRAKVWLPVAGAAVGAEQVAAPDLVPVPVVAVHVLGEG
eukprot:CAMPEP_0118965800 /NCGR_PEP_ID=MMETSP1173-20130426/3324_1 /TAXON_ID=1034831 /ORGANISM="Rhizochromulina marina cf, Strain CCMP1243" /LENGTH=57 /DNA_ID=CAMNT_0006914473 /DNA_START=63 /DNA_END=231 /DNA_ORIENTATION=+